MSVCKLISQNKTTVTIACSWQHLDKNIPDISGGDNPGVFLSGLKEMELESSLVFLLCKFIAVPHDKLENVNSLKIIVINSNFFQ